MTHRLTVPVAALVRREKKAAQRRAAAAPLRGSRTLLPRVQASKKSPLEFCEMLVVVALPCGSME